MKKIFLLIVIAGLAALPARSTAPNSSTAMPESQAAAAHSALLEQRGAFINPSAQAGCAQAGVYFLSDPPKCLTRDGLQVVGRSPDRFTPAILPGR